jgi:hypothetical protein
MAIVEFYDGPKASHPFVSVVDDHPPPVGALVNISKVTWRVARVTWAVDQRTGERPQLRANVELAKPEVP